MEPVRPGALGAFAKSRKPWAPPKEIYAPEASAALRDRLLGELGGLTSADEATAWAQRALGAKNTLRNVDATLVGLCSWMTELGEDGEAPLPLPPQAGQGRAETAAPPGRAELMAALRDSVELGAAKEAPLICGRTHAQAASPGHTASAYA